jgi:SAM-dependent methyltransferase
LGGYTYYDNERFLEQFEKRRNRDESPNNAIEGPAFLELMDNPEGKDVLDLGCGDGQFGIELLERSAATYHGMDGSKRMIHKAKEVLSDREARLQCANITELDVDKGTYHMVVSRLVFHYLPDLSDLFARIHQVLKEDGQFVFSVQHPIITASMESASGGRRSNWIVDDYFNIGDRTETWMDQQVTKYHRTIEQYIENLLQAGFKIEGLKEGTPERKFFSTTEEYERRKRIPLVLILAGRKT